MAQASCIYDLEYVQKNFPTITYLTVFSRGKNKVITPQLNQPYDQTDTVRGIEMVMGWQIDRMKLEVPRFIAWAWFSLAVIWLCVIVWGGRTSDWSTAMAFGQLLAACVGLVIIHARD
jgi:hypothetical protein